MEYLFCFICYLYTLLTIIDTTNINTTRVNVISSTCKMYTDGYSNCSKYDLQICHTRNICPRRKPTNPKGCFNYLTYTDLKADTGSMQHFQPPSEKIQDMMGFVIVVVNRDTHGQSSADFIITSCENSRTKTTNGMNITTTNVQIGQPYDQIFNFELTIEMDCAISSCYGQECEMCVTTEKTTAYTSADTLQTNIYVSDDQTTHYTQNVETGNSVSTQQVKTSNLTTQRVKANNILPTQGVTTSYILPTQGVKTSNILPTQRLKTSNILTTQRVNTGNEPSTPRTTSTEHTENSMTTVRRKGIASTLSDENLTVVGRQHLNTGPILGIVFGVCGGIILVLILLYIIGYHKKTRKTAVEDVPEIHIENDGAVETHEQFERMGEQMNVLSGSVSNINEYPPGTSIFFRPDSQRPIQDDDILNSPIHDSEIQETSTEKYINPEYPQNNCERDRKRKKKRKKSKRSKETYGSKRDKNIPTELINGNERNVSNYTEPEIDGAVERQIVEAGVSSLEQQNPETEMTNLEQQNPETGVSNLEQQTEVTKLERQNPETGVSNLEQQTEMTNLEQQNPETGVSNLEQQAEMTNLEKQNAETAVSNLEQQTEVTNLEQQNQETIVFNLEQQNSGTERSSLERQNVEAGLSNSATASQLNHRYTTEESDYGDRIKSKKKKKHKHKRRHHIDKVDISTVHDDGDGYETHIIGTI